MEEELLVEEDSIFSQSLVNYEEETQSGQIGKEFTRIYGFSYIILDKRA